jgi:hypothetical protein
VQVGRGSRDESIAILTCGELQEVLAFLAPSGRARPASGSPAETGGGPSVLGDKRAFIVLEHPQLFAHPFLLRLHFAQALEIRLRVQVSTPAHDATLHDLQAGASQPPSYIPDCENELCSARIGMMLTKCFDLGQEI